MLTGFQGSVYVHVALALLLTASLGHAKPFGQLSGQAQLGGANARAEGAGGHHYVRSGSRPPAVQSIVPLIQQANQVEGAGGNEACRNFFRRDFLDQWAQSGKRICSTQCSTAAGASATAQDQDTSAPSMTMWSITHKTKTFNAVYARNIQMSDSVAYMGHTVARDTQLPHPEAGSLRIGCEMCDPAALQQAAGKDKYMDVVHRALTPGGNATCEHWVEHPVYFMTRYDSTNMFHHSEDLVMLFATLYVLQKANVPLDTLQIVITDDLEYGHFIEIEKRISFPHRIRYLTEHPYPRNTCFRHLILPGFVAPSFMSVYGPGQPTTCKAPTLVAFSHWARSLFAETLQPVRIADILAAARHNQTLAAAAAAAAAAERRAAPAPPPYPRAYRPYQPPRPITKYIVWASRRDFQSMHETVKPLGSWQRARFISNEKQLVLALFQETMEWNDRNCFRKKALGCRNSTVVFQFVDLEPFAAHFHPEQVERLGRMSILVGLHGAAMANIMWMAPGSGAVVEVMHNSAGNYHYHNMAVWTGQKYTPVLSGGQEANIAGTVDALRGAMDYVSSITAPAAAAPPPPAVAGAGAAVAAATAGAAAGLQVAAGGAKSTTAGIKSLAVRSVREGTGNVTLPKPS